MLLRFFSLLVLLLEGATARYPSTPISELRRKVEHAEGLSKRDINPAKIYTAYNLSVPIDHFHNDTKYEPHVDGTFNLRYYLDDSHYKPGGPVIVLCSGETTADDRLPYMQKGILAQLAEATGGMALILEHRYYGTSFPVDDLSTKNLRFLTTDQALADSAYFARNVVFKGYEDKKLNPPDTPWIAYGGSYAGAFVAFLRKLYPDAYYGAISSSGVTEAIYDYWKYYDAARLFGPQDAIRTQQEIIQVADNILLIPQYQKYTQQLKDAFLLPNLTRNDDFGNVISLGIAGLQSTNWDPAINDLSWKYYLGNISSNEVIWPATQDSRTEVELLLKATNHNSTQSNFVTRMLNFIGWNNYSQIAPCRESGNSQDECFTSYDDSFYSKTSLSQQVWRCWSYQVCTEWGFLQTGSGVPKSIRPVISRAVDLHFTSEVCRAAFNINQPSDVQAVNKYGGFGISYPRLAIIDGASDPWRAATPHALGQPARKSSTEEPYILIAGGAVHHWDENGLFPNETTANLPPNPVADAQSAEASFVLAWLKEFKSSGSPSSPSGTGSGTATGSAAASSSSGAASALVRGGDATSAALVAAVVTLGMTFGAGLSIIRASIAV